MRERRRTGRGERENGRTRCRRSKKTVCPFLFLSSASPAHLKYRADLDQVEDKLRVWSRDRLKTLKSAELTELYLVVAPDSSVPSKKEDLVSAIVAARQPHPPPVSDLTAISESESGGSESPHPLTSREGSPDESPQEPRRRSGGGGSAAPTSRPAKVHPRKKTVVGRRSGVRDQVPTPPHTSDEGDNDGEDSAGEATEVEVSRADEQEAIDEEEEEEDELALRPSSTRMTRRASQVEMPPPPVPVNRRAHARTRSSAANVLSEMVESSSSSSSAAANPAPPPPPRNLKKPAAPSPKQKPRRQFDNLIKPDSPMIFTSPVAHRTRGSQPHSSDRAAASTSSSSNVRAAKKKAVAKLSKLDKGKGRADDASSEEEDEDEYMGSGSDQEGDGDTTIQPDTLVLSDSDSELDIDPDSSLEIIDPSRLRRLAGEKKPTAPSNLPVGRRRSARTAKQVDTPPSDADEESGGEETERESRSPEVEGMVDEEEEEEGDSDVEIVEEETSSRLARRREGRRVVNLKGKGRAVEEEEEEAEAEDEEDEMMVDDEEGEDEEEGASSLSSFLRGAETDFVSFLVIL